MKGVDDLDLNGLKIIQDPNMFCFGMDAVLLSHFAKARPGERVVDLGTGTGVIPILMSGRSEDTYFYGVEIQAPMADMARRSVLLNSLENRIQIIEGPRALIFGLENMAGDHNLPYAMVPV